MSNPIKIIDKMEPIVKARQNYDIVTKENQPILQILQKFQVALGNLSDLQIPNISTISDTTLDEVITEHLNSLLQVSQAFHFYSKALKDDCSNFEKILQTRQGQRESIESEIKSLNNNIINMLDRNSEGNILELREQLNKKMALLKKSSRNKDKSKATEEIKNEYNDYYQVLLSFKSKKVKLGKMINKIQELLRNYYNTFAKSDITCRTSLVSDGLRQISTHLNDLGNNIEKSTEVLKEKNLDFSKDFKFYTQNMNIEFADSSLPPFIECNPVKKRSATLETSDNVNITPFRFYQFPQYIARLKFDFAAEFSNELASKKGQKVGVLKEKDPTEGWTLCMSLCNKRFGYVPTEYLEKVGQGIAISMEDVNTGGFNCDAGRILVYIKEETEGQILCEDYLGKQLPIPSSKLIVL